MVDSKLEQNATELTDPGTEATTATSEYKHSILKAIPKPESWELAVTTTFDPAASQYQGKWKNEH